MLTLSSVIFSIAGAIIMILLAVVGFFAKASLNEVKEISKKLTMMREEVLSNYVRKSDMEKNEKSHQELWIEVHEAQKKIEVVKATCSERHPDKPRRKK